jgi:hypothetical protein
LLLAVLGYRSLASNTGANDEFGVMIARNTKRYRALSLDKVRARSHGTCMDGRR